MAQTNSRISLRHIQIDKANSLMVIATASAAACLVFSLVSIKSLYAQARYNQKVIVAQEKSVKQVKADVQSLDTLKGSYEVFVKEPTNIIKGSSTGQGDKDGDNAKITLDALPSVYDFPGMISGFNKIFSKGSYSELAIGGTDSEIAEKANVAATIVEVPLSFSAEGSAAGAQELLKLLDSSIRPINVKSVTFSGDSQGKLKVTVNTITYYQPKKTFSVTTEVIK